MPTYEFLCQNCKEASAFICSITEYERKKKRGNKCPKCRAQRWSSKFPDFRVGPPRQVRRVTYMAETIFL